MRKRNNPSRMLWFVTLPQTLLTAALSVSLARGMNTNVLWALCITLALHVPFTLYAILRRKQPAVDTWAAVALSVFSCLALGAFLPLLDGAVLVTGWISLRLIALLLCGMTGLYAVLTLASIAAAPTKIGRSVIALVALPFSWFFLFNLLTGVLMGTAVMMLLIAGAFVAVFFLGRIIFSLGTQALATSGTQKRDLTLLYAIFSIILPLAGLGLNLSLGNLFGDFSSPAFFVVPVLNGALLLLPPPEDKRLRLLRFLLLSAALPYFVYFFVVFVPHLPLGFLGLLIVAGALLFAPTGALTLQIVALNRERRALAASWRGAQMALSFAAALLLLPACLLTSVVGDRANFENAKTYLPSSQAASGKDVNLAQLQRTLHHAPATWEISRSMFVDFETASNTPLLSAAYAALVLDGKVMLDSEIDHLRALFFDDLRAQGSGAEGLTLNGNRLTGVRLRDVTTETVYDADIGASRTWVHLTLEGGSRSGDEYVTRFFLPDGAYIADYYLDVGTERKHGILADERAAMLVYENIVRVQKDPGVIRYADDRRLELRVFPFARDEVRRTGFEVIHSQSLALALDGQTVALHAERAPEEVRFQGGVLVSAAHKRTLPQASPRKPSYYFIVDSSANSLIDAQVSLIQDYASMAGIADAQVIFASYSLTTTSLADVHTVRATPRSGFNLALAVRTILAEHPDETVPVILFTSSNPAGAILPEHCSLLAKRFPDSPYYYHLRDDLALAPFALDGNAAQPLATEPFFAPMRAYHGTRVRDDDQSEMLALPSAEAFTLSGKQYADALALDMALRSRPWMDAGTSLTMLRASFRAHVLTPQSALIVVETREQEAEIWKAQEKLLAQDAAMARQTLAEPSPLLMLASTLGLACAGLLLRRRKRRAEQLAR